MRNFSSPEPNIGINVPLDCYGTCDPKLAAQVAQVEAVLEYDRALEPNNPFPHEVGVAVLAHCSGRQRRSFGLGTKCGMTISCKLFNIETGGEETPLGEIPPLQGPANITVKKGSTVTWQTKDIVSHPD